MRGAYNHSVWSYSNISSCSICDWCKSREMITSTNGGKLLCRPSSSYKKLLDRVAFWIVYIAWRVGYKILGNNATSVGVGRRNDFFCEYVAETVSLLLLSILLCILLLWWCSKIAKWTGPINVNMRFHEIALFIVFYTVLLHKVMCRSTCK